MKLSFNFHSFRKLGQSIIDSCFPNHCFLCDIECPGDQALCADCFSELPRIVSACPQCSAMLPVDKLYCGQCQRSPPPYRFCLAAFSYQSVMPYLISQYKFHGQLLLSRLFAQSLADKVLQAYQEDVLPDVIIPVPLHINRLRERGFNQAHEIAKQLSKRLSIPVDSSHLKRHKATQAQTLIATKERAQNVKNAFHAELSVKHVALVDDVVTTGATIAAACHALEKSGVEIIDVWCIARPPLH